MYNNSGFPWTKGMKIGMVNKYYFKAWNASWHCFDYLNVAPFFKRCWNRCNLSTNYAIKHLMDCSLPCRLLNCLSVVGAGISKMNFTFARSTSIPLFDIIKPKSFLIVTPNMNFFDLRLTLYYSNLSNILARTSK